MTLPLLIACILPAQASAPPPLPPDVPAWTAAADAPPTVDWLVETEERPARVLRRAEGSELVLTNGLVRRVFRIAPNAATVALDDLMTGASLLRGVKPEAVVRLDGEDLSIGGLVGQPDYAYLRETWIDDLQADPDAFRLAGVEIGATVARFPWKRSRHSEDRPWPPPGASLDLRFEAPNDTLPKGLEVHVHYELYDGIPVFAKWLTIVNGSERPVRVDSFQSELLAIVEAESAVERKERWLLPGLHAVSDYAFHGMDSGSSNETIQWIADPQYETQVNYPRETPALLVSRPPIGPDFLLEPGASLETYRTFVLVFDSTERERRGLSVRRMMRTLAPWSTENPLMMHVRSAEPDAVRLAIDQCAAVGFEMAILTFGSGFDIENSSPEYLARMRALADYAQERGVELGGYSLLASRHISDEDDVLHPDTGKPGGAIFGHAPCLESHWGRAHLRQLRRFFEATGMNLLEHDGSYPGDVCASTSHPGHEGLGDSQWRQWQAITAFYQWSRARGLYLNVPDFYFLSGSNKTGMGYRETNWSLPRREQVLHARQNIFDGTWEKTPSMGWMFVPLVEYHGGGAAATLEPLSEHLADLDAHYAASFGAGVQACWRGPRLFDTQETKALVERWVGFYKTHRAILESDVIHLRRADGRDWDGLLHVNPNLPEKGLAALYNPLDGPIERTIELPLYYTGLTQSARIRQRDGRPAEYTLDREYRVRVTVELPPHGMTWLVIE